MTKSNHTAVTVIHTRCSAFNPLQLFGYLHELYSYIIEKPCQVIYLSVYLVNYYVTLLADSLWDT